VQKKDARTAPLAQARPFGAARLWWRAGGGGGGGGGEGGEEEKRKSLAGASPTQRLALWLYLGAPGRGRSYPSVPSSVAHM
jgi:hypothetical protein